MSALATIGRVFVDEHGMAWPTPQFSKGQVDKAGQVLVNPLSTDVEIASATEIMGNWRQCHGYPISTFRTTLGKRLARAEIHGAIVSQRLKRAPSIIAKLKRFDKMQLSRMQDIGGLRAVVSTIEQVRILQNEYRQVGKFQHQLASVCR